MMDLAFLLIVVLTTVLTSPIYADVPRCDKNNPDFSKSPFCFPDDYNMDIVPASDGPLHVNVDIFVFEVSKIDDISLSMTFELYFDMTWTESRLIINESSPEWEAGGGTVMGSINFIKSMWLPDIQIQNLKNFQLRSIVTDVAGLIIFKDKKVLYTVATEAIISCPMKFSAYPLDHQECKFQVGCYIHDATQIWFNGTFGHDTVNQRAQQYEINIVPLDEIDRTVVWAERDYSQTGFKIKLVRRRTPVLLQTYLPSGLFVVVSWISFIVPPEIVPGRMALLVTLFLVLVNIFNSVTANAPKSEGLTAVETWVVMCILHVFCVLLEYAIILKIIQVEKRKVTTRLLKLDRANNALSASNTSLNNKSLIFSAGANSANNEGSNGSNNGSATLSNNISNHLTRCFSSSHCCKPNSPPTHNHRGASPRSSGLPEDCCEQNGTENTASEAVNNDNRVSSTHRNCGCDSDHHSHRRKFQRVNKASTNPTNQVEQIFEAEQPFLGGGRSTHVPSAPPARHMAPHHPLLSNLEHNDHLLRHRAAHAVHNSAGHSARVTGVGHLPHQSYHHRHPTPLSTFGGSGPDMAHVPTTTENVESWARIDFTMGAGSDRIGPAGSRSAPVTTGNSPTQSLGMRSQANDHLRLQAKYEQIDRIARALFPFIFLLVNVCYWSYYLILTDALQDFWNCGGFGECEKMKKNCDHYAWPCD
eukprot:12399.XXX_323856_316976_1 [CDS] Oithona nana genome sequencing.